MAIAYKLAGVTVPAENIYLRWNGDEGFEGAAAADGTGSMGAVTFHDLDGSLEVRGFMSFTIDETDCTTAPRLFTGWIWERDYTRGGDEQTAAAHVVSSQLIDPNAVLSIRLITGSDGKRPTETHIERIDWLLGSSYLTGLIEDFGLVNRVNPRTMGEADYRGQYPSQVLADLAGPLFRLFFAYYDQTNAGIGLFFDFPNATTWQSTLSISNDPADITSTCLPVGQDAQLHRDPSSVYSLVRAENGTRYRATETNATTLATFFTDNGFGNRGFLLESTRIGSNTTAQQFADALLNQYSTERDTITCTLHQVPSTQVGLIDAGMSIDATFTHFPGYETPVTMRVERRTFRQSEGRRDLYDITLTLSNGGLASPGGGGEPGDFPHPPPAVGGIVQQVSGSGNVQMPSPITDGNTLVAVATCRASSMAGTWISDRGYTTGPDGQVNDPGGTNTAVIVYKTASSESQYIGGTVGATNIDINTTVTWYELAGGWTLDQHGKTQSVGTSVTTPTITAAANSLVFGVVGQGQGGAYDSVAGTLTYTTDPPMVEDYDTYNAAGGHPNHLAAHYAGGGSIALIAVNSGNVGLSGTDYNYVALIASFTSSDLSSTEPPSPGQWVYGEIVTMVGAVGTTLFPYADGSLIVKVDGVTISPASYTETDPAAGTFTLSWVPDTDETVTVSYQGR